MPKNGLVQWGWNDLEELLQCPICLEIPAVGVVEQCRHGHHICANCRTKVDSCPLCKCEFYGTRNFVAEELIRHHEILKNIVMLNNIVTAESKKEKKKTKLRVSAPVFVPNNNFPPRRQVNTPNATKGIYPCRIANCTTKLPLSRLLNHVRTFHPNCLTESVVDFTDSYNHSWEIPYNNKSYINKISYAIFIRGIGLIFLNLEILRPGCLIAFIQMALKYCKAQTFMARLEFFSQSNNYSYTTRLISIKDNFDDMLLRNTCYALSNTQLRNVSNNKKFNCKIIVSQFGILDHNILTTPNAEQIRIIAGIRASLIEENKRKLKKVTNHYNANKATTSNAINCSNSSNGIETTFTLFNTVTRVEPVSGKRKNKKKNRNNV